MAINKDLFSRASTEAAEKELRKGSWKAYHEYEVRHTRHGGPHVLAPQSGLGDYDEYFPLVSHPTLFLMFARLGDDGEITEEVWLDWIKGYGVLGLERGTSVREIVEDHRDLGLGIDSLLDELEQLDAMGVPYSSNSGRMEGGPAESYRNFKSEALKATRLLRVYEATSQEDPDVDLMGRHAERDFGIRISTPREAKAWGLGWLASEIDPVISEECYPALYPMGDRVAQGWGFHSLLGAMYLQMAWLVAAKEEVHCKQCGRIIDYEQPEIPREQLPEQPGWHRPHKTRSDKEFCGKGCANKWYYEHVTKPRMVHR
jgi:hypothetical protein